MLVLVMVLEPAVYKLLLLYVIEILLPELFQFWQDQESMEM